MDDDWLSARLLAKEQDWNSHQSFVKCFLIPICTFLFSLTNLGIFWRNLRRAEISGVPVDSKITICGTRVCCGRIINGEGEKEVKINAGIDWHI
ncbi:hypothetical protein Pfo_007156 [Paulownia fortunei]|nr:hypothetical protein Pfo_007156 [Paulownia fortunei]